MVIIKYIYMNKIKGCVGIPGNPRQTRAKPAPPTLPLKTSATPDPIRFPGVPLALEEGRPATRLAQRSTQKRKGVTDAFCAWRPLQAGGMAPPPEEREVTGTRDANWNPSQGEGKASGAFIARRLPSSATAHPRRRGPTAEEKREIPRHRPRPGSDMDNQD